MCSQEAHLCKIGCALVLKIQNLSLGLKTNNATLRESEILNFLLNSFISEKGLCSLETYIFCFTLLTRSLSLFFLQYSVKNLQFALTVEPDNLRILEKLTWAQNQRQTGQPTIPSTIGDELESNPFMRVDLPAIQVCRLFHSSSKYMFGSSFGGA